jgi:hypothetical protein
MITQHPPSRSLSSASVTVTATPSSTVFQPQSAVSVSSETILKHPPAYPCKNLIKFFQNVSLQKLFLIGTKMVFTIFIPVLKKPKYVLNHFLINEILISNPNKRQYSPSSHF